MQSQTFGPFTDGIQTDPINFEGGFSHLSCLNLTEEPGVLRINREMTVETEAASTNDITTLITDFEPYSVNATYTLYGIGGTGNRIYGRNTSNVWTLVHDDALTGSDSQLKVFGANLYWTSLGKLGKYDGTTWTDSFQATSETTNPKYLEIFAGFLFVGGGRYIDSLDADGTTWHTGATAGTNTLTLPLGTVIKDMRVWNDRLAILTGSSDGSGNNKIYLWDGTSTTYETPVPAPSGGQAIYNYNNHLLLFASDGTIHEFNGASFNIYKTLRDIAVPIATTTFTFRPGGFTIHEGNLLFGVTASASSFPSGVYSLSQPGGGRPIYLSLYTGTSQRNFTASIGAVYSGGTVGTLYIAWSESSTFAVDKQASTTLWSSWVTGPTYTAIAYADTVNHDFGSPEQKQVIGIKLHTSTPLTTASNSNGTGHTFTILTDPDRSGTFTQQKIVTNGMEDNTLYFATGLICKNIRFRIAFSWGNSGTGYANLKGYTPIYKILGNTSNA